MTSLLLATALLALQPTEAPLTAGQLYDGCVRYVAAGPGPDADDIAIACAAHEVTAQVMVAADEAARAAGIGGDSRRFCPPPEVLDGESRALARAFVFYVDRNPASRSSEADEVFDQALAEKWPCPR